MEKKSQVKGNPLPWEARFAARLRAERILRGWTQSDVALRAGAAGLRVTQQQIDRLEHSDRGLRLDEAMVLASVFGNSVEDMASADGPAISDIESQVATLEGAAQSLVLVVERLRADGAETRTRRATVDAACEVLLSAPTAAFADAKATRGAAINLQMIYADVSPMLDIHLGAIHSAIEKHLEVSPLLRAWFEKL